MKFLHHTLFVFLSFFIAVGSTTLVAASANPSKNKLATQTGKININTASASLLAITMKGIGIKIAHRIVSYRNAYGPYVDIDALTKVGGVGSSTVQKNAHLIGVN